MVPRLLRLHPSTYQRLSRLSKEAERDGAYRVAKRLRAVVLNSEGHTSGELAKILQAPRSKVSDWLQRYQAEGVDGLLEGYRSGRPSELTEKQQQELGDILDSGPVSYGLDSGIWTSCWREPMPRRRTDGTAAFIPPLKKSPVATLGAHLHRRSELPARFDAPRHLEPRRAPSGNSRERENAKT
ncbi:MAG: helix-turn-helix domain-containing protein [Bryobacteraceae bacterium]